VGIFGFFPLFPRCSQKVPKFQDAFPKMLPIAPRFYPIWFAQSSTPLYITYNPGVHICFYFARGGSKKVLPLGGVLKVPKQIADGPMNMARSGKKKSFEL